MIKKILPDKSFLKVLSVSLVFLGAFLFFSQFSNLAYAQVDVGMQYGEQTGLSNTDPRIVVARVIRIALGFVGIVTVILIIYGGWLYMTSEGNAEKITKAQQIIKNAAIGLLIILSAFAIVSFILSGWESGGNGGSTAVPGGGVDYRGGVGALGACSVENVYPEDLAKEIPRNSSLMVTFREEVNPSDICGENICNGSTVNSDNVKLFKQAERSGCFDSLPGGCSLVAMKVFSKDNKTFVFSPEQYLGLATENTWYGIRLTNDIRKKDNSDGIFKNCRSDYLEWQFEVSNKFDLTSPQVESIFPLADSDNADGTNNKDLVSSTGLAVSATGKITVNNPQASASASVGAVTKTSGNTNLSVQGQYNCNLDGTINLSVSSDNKINASGISGLLSPVNIANKKAEIGCGLSVLLGDDFNSGNAWSFKVSSQKTADSIIVGGKTYVLGTDISVGSSNNETASNIATVLSTNSDIRASASSNTVVITAKIAGQKGNTINISSSNNTRLAIVAMSGGADQEIAYTVKGKKDQSKNAIIQINFNEAVNPLTLSGTSADLANYIKVTSGGNVLSGKYVVSNQYRTVEFVPEQECGINSCGEKMYCLPGDSEINVEFKASTLSACGNDNCASKSPYNTCTNGHCQNNFQENYPQSVVPFDGVVDLSFNSLDGNKNGKAEGPNDDNFSWKFFTTSLMDATPPIITRTAPSVSSTTQNLVLPIELDFNKVMMASSLKTGSSQVLDRQQTELQKKNAYINHQHLNMWNFTNLPLGYWITKENLEIGTPDGVPDYTKVTINHTLLADNSKYRAQGGSGLKDIYQNCFAPSSGPACFGGPSCCDGTAVNKADCR